MSECSHFVVLFNICFIALQTYYEEKKIEKKYVYSLAFIIKFYLFSNTSNSNSKKSKPIYIKKRFLEGNLVRASFYVTILYLHKLPGKTSIVRKRIRYDVCMSDMQYGRPSLREGRSLNRRTSYGKRIDDVKSSPNRSPVRSFADINGAPLRPRCSGKIAARHDSNVYRADVPHRFSFLAPLFPITLITN